MIDSCNRHPHPVSGYKIWRHWRTNLRSRGRNQGRDLRRRRLNVSCDCDLQTTCISWILGDMAEEATSEASRTISVAAIQRFAISIMFSDLRRYGDNNGSRSLWESFSNDMTTATITAVVVVIGDLGLGFD
ncbi:hypothetical protein TIFTF001_014317 [Ficus carica]|uniref:Uncharacterized protein n=1 Tax=Ficus carica TaxID=3494 RepID=A0AA88AFT2_FICCA|nr:hypothetical protein TIFTF001_014317 [Ficus carica]